MIAGEGSGNGTNSECKSGAGGGVGGGGVGVCVCVWGITIKLLRIYKVYGHIFIMMLRRSWKVVAIFFAKNWGRS